ncbi:MAG: two-component system response regulator RppA [Cyanobacteria bacterium J06592_8]
MRILLVEDEPDLGNAIKRALHLEKYLVDWVEDGADAWNHLDTPTMEYTLAILDWLLPTLSGLELLRRLRQKHNSLPVLMLTAKDSLEDRVIGLDTGADDYLVKPFRMAELLARVRALQRRSPQLQPQQLQVGNLRLDCGSRIVYLLSNNGNLQEVPLTNKEFLLLEYFMNHPNQVMTSDQIRNQLWEISAEPMSNVVAAQMRLLRRKLESIGCTVPIETVHGIGYRLNLSKKDESK